MMTTSRALRFSIWNRVVSMVVAKHMRKTDQMYIKEINYHNRIAFISLLLVHYSSFIRSIHYNYWTSSSCMNESSQSHLDYHNKCICILRISELLSRLRLLRYSFEWVNPLTSYVLRLLDQAIIFGHAASQSSTFEFHSIALHIRRYLIPTATVYFRISEMGMSELNGVETFLFRTIVIENE